MNGIQKLFGAVAYGAFRGAVSAYCSLTEDEKLRLNQQTAERMANRAFLGKLECPYSEDEIDFIKEFYQKRE